jgi:hypothetical protein
MIRVKLFRIDPFVAAGIAIVASAVYGLLLTPMPAKAATVTPGVCRAVMIFDRSGSVGAAGITTMKEQVKRVFEPTGVYDPKIELAFWSFSSGGTGTFGYDTPGFGYVSSKGPINTGFAAQLNAMASSGGTNYEQGFGYNGGVRNSALGDIPDKADIIVFMTDGKPNAPGNGADGNPTAVAAGRAAALQYLSAGKVVLGGLVGSGADTATLARVINGNPNNHANLFTVSNNYNDLSAKLKQQIGTQCAALNPPCPYNPAILADDPGCKPPAVAPYTLIPSATTNNTVISSDESATFQYKVTNTTTNPSASTGWSIKQVVVDKGQSADPLSFGTDNYRDDYSCPALMSLISNKGTCQDNVAQGAKVLPTGVTILTDAEAGTASNLSVEDRWPVGTKVCYVLVVAKPTEKDTPINRHSRASCVVIGKRPMVQIHGGDLNVGGRIVGDTEDPNAIASKIQTGLTVKSAPVDGTFGSWVEYGVFAPGPIIGTGSASGLENGYRPATTSDQQGLWSRLTFANKNDEFGAFEASRTMPDTAAAVIASTQEIGELPDSAAFNGAVTSGMYKKPSGNFTLGASTIGKGTSVVVYVPNGTVTIDGNLSYTDEPLSAIRDIPRLVIVARNINIKSGVIRVDAWLLARNSANGIGGGIVDTCSDGPAALTVSDCDKQLIINGPVMARQLLLRRTAGSGSGAASDQPGEIINLRADTYLPAAGRGTVTTVPTTTFSVELPPRF